MTCESLIGRQRGWCVGDMVDRSIIWRRQRGPWIVSRCRKGAYSCQENFILWLRFHRVGVLHRPGEVQRAAPGRVIHCK